MSLKKQRIFAAAGAAALVAAAAAAVFLLWKPAPEGIVVGASVLPDSLNPVLPRNGAAQDADELLFDGLVNFEVDAASGTSYAALALAESIEQDKATKKLYRARLRQASWHDGTPVTAEDVVFSFAAYVEKANASPKAAYLSSFIESVRAGEDGTVEIEFRLPIPEYRALPVLAFKIIPSTYRGKRMSVDLRSGENERAFATAPVGTGPFMLESWEIGKWVAFKANPGYFKKMPGSPAIVLRKVADPVVRMEEFRRGRINLVLETSPLDRTSAERIPGTDINWYKPYSFYQVAINTRSPLFARTEARLALAHALDKKALVPKVTDREKGVLINSGPFPADLFAANLPEYDVPPLRDPAPADLATARRLGVDGGLPGKTVALLYPDSLGEFGERMARGIADQLAATGLQVEPKRTGDQVFKRLVFSEKDYDLALVYSDGFDNVYSGLVDWLRSDGTRNVYGVADAELDSLLDAWDGTSTATEWVAAVRRVHERVAQLAPAVFLCTIEKDVYSRGIRDIAIVSDNPFLSAEDWSQSG